MKNEPDAGVDAAKLVLEQDRQARAAELMQIIERESKRLNCDVLAEARLTPDGRVGAVWGVVAR